MTASGLGRRLTAVANRRAVLIAVVAAAGVAVLVRVPFFFWPLMADEGGYAYTAQWWFRGLTLYSDDLWFDRPQGIFVAFKLGSLLFGDATWAIRLWGALWAAGTTVAVWLVARRLVGDHAAAAGALVYAIFSAHTHIEGFSANAEVFMVLPSTLSVYFLLRGQPAAAGLLASASTLLKPSGAAALLMGVAWLLYLRSGRRDWFRFVAASLPLPLLALAHGMVTVGFGTYLDAVLLVRLDVPRPNPLDAALDFGVATLPVWAPLAILARFGLPAMPRHGRVLIALWLGFSFAGVAMGGNWWEHYFIQLVPPLAVAAGVGLAQLWRSTVARRWLGIAVALLPMFVIASFVGAGPSQGSWDLLGRQAYLIAADVGDYIRANTDEGETIFVIYAEPEVYHLAGRRSAVFSLYGHHFNADAGEYERMLASVQDRKPSYVAVLNRLDVLDPDGRLLRVLKDGYELEKQFAAGIETGLPPASLYRRR